ncbi:MAG: PqqD family protein [Clostridioides sp.]|jgi:hypothetical protein|nr:PqqD family protein [Clostridioides sp.]
MKTKKNNTNTTTNEDILSIVYKIVDDLEYDVAEDGIVTVMKRQDHWVQNLFRKFHFRIPEITRISMDEYGSFLFNRIDGKRTVKELGELMYEEFGEDANPLYERILVFLNHIDVNAEYIYIVDDGKVEGDKPEAETELTSDDE